MFCAEEMPRRKSAARAKWTSFFMFLMTPPGNAIVARLTEIQDRTVHQGVTGSPPVRDDVLPWEGWTSVNTCTGLRRMAIIMAEPKKGKWEETREVGQSEDWRPATAKALRKIRRIRTAEAVPFQNRFKLQHNRNAGSILRSVAPASPLLGLRLESSIRNHPLFAKVSPRLTDEVGRAAIESRL